MKKNRKLNTLQILALAAIALMFIVAFVIYFLTRSNESDTSSPISNYDQKVKNLSKEYKDNIFAALYKMIEYNNHKGITKKEIGTIYIRDSSDQQTTLEENQKYTGSFIVDIENIKQSYSIQYAFARASGNTLSSGYPILVSCLAKKDLIYDDFNCKNITSADIVSSNDPFIRKLPYETPNYTVSGFEDENGEKKITITVQSSYNSERTRERYNMYREEAKKWLDSQDVDLSKYTLEWRNIFNEVLFD